MGWRLTPITSERICIIYLSLCSCTLFICFVCVCVCLCCDFFYFTISLLWKIHDKVNIVCVCVFAFGIVLEAIKRFSLYSSSSSINNKNGNKRQAHTAQFPNARALYMRINGNIVIIRSTHSHPPVPVPFSLLHFNPDSHRNTKYAYCSLD